MNDKAFNFGMEVIQQSHKKPVIVQFSAEGCGPCFWMEKTLIEVAREQKENIDFVSILSKDVKTEVEAYRIINSPTTLLFLKGKEATRLKGALPKMVVEQWLNDHTK